MNDFDITVAICTWNRSALLRQTLQQLTQAEVPHGTTWEVLVINNNSTDDTDAVVDSFLPTLPIRRVFEPNPGISHARNRALAESRGAWLIFTDDDVLVDRKWIVEFSGTARRFHSAAIVGGRIDPWFTSTPDPELMRAFPIAQHGFCGLDHGPDERLLTPTEDLYTANMAVRPAAIGGLRFDSAFGPRPTSSVTGDDTDFVRRVKASGAQVAWSPKMKVQHYVNPARLTLPYLTQFYIDHARTLVRLGTMPESLMPRGGAILWGAPRWLWRSVTTAFLRYQVARLTGDHDALTRLRELCFLRGMLLERRALHRQPLQSANSQ